MGKDKLAEVFAKMDKRYGKGSVNRLKDMTFPDYVRTSTGSLGLDYATGGGWPVGRMIELYGWESSGKTTIAKQALAEFQKVFPDRACAFIDTEHAFDKKYAKNLGVDVDNLIINQPDSGEEGFDILIELIRTGDLGMAVFDSIAVARPKKMIEGELDEQHLGLHARLLSNVLPRLASACSENNTTLILTNQLRHKIGVMFGSPDTTPGGNSMRFYASLRVELIKILSKKVNDGDDQIGNQFKAKVIKNKTAPPFREATYDIIYGEGVDIFGEIVDFATDLGIFQKSGTWYSYEATKLGQGRQNVIQLLRDNEGLVEEILPLVKEKYGLV